MKKVAVFIIVTLLILTTAVVYSGSSAIISNPVGVPQDLVIIYDSHGQLQQTIKRCSIGNETVCDSRGQLDNATWAYASTFPSLLKRIDIFVSSGDTTEGTPD